MKQPKVIHKKLKRQNALGYWRPGKIEIDPRLSPKEYLETLIHEGLHEFAAYLDEQVVIDLGGDLCKLVWSQGFRKIERRENLHK